MLFVINMFKVLVLITYLDEILIIQLGLSFEIQYMAF
jgi:hypothetical protein